MSEGNNQTSENAKGFFMFLAEGEHESQGSQILDDNGVAIDDDAGLPLLDDGV